MSEIIKDRVSEDDPEAQSRKRIFRLRRFELLGIPVDDIHPEDLDEYLKLLYSSPSYHQVFFLRTFDLLRARRNPELRKCLREASLVIPVSKGLQRALNKLYRCKVHRYAPFEFIIKLLNVLESLRGGMFLLGDRQPDLGRTEINLKQTFPGSQVLGRYTGYFSKTMEKNIVTAISKAAPHLLLCGGGIHGNNMWVYYMRQHFPRGIQVWCSECFDYFIARRKRPNRVSFRKGREFFQESAHKPWRILRVPFYFYFRWLVLWSRLTRPHP